MQRSNKPWPPLSSSKERHTSPGIRLNLAGDVTVMSIIGESEWNRDD